MERDSFGSRFAVIMAFAGSAIGLGNIWRFPYMVGEGGGAVFVLIYVVSTVFIALPIFFAESIIGRRSRSNCLGAMRSLARGKRIWEAFGFLSVLTPMLIVSYYCVVGGWSFKFLLLSLGGKFSSADPASVRDIYGTFVDGTWGPALCFTVFLALTCLIPAFGIKSGIEKFSKVSMPVLFVIIVAVAAYSMSLPGSGEGVDYLFRPDLSKLSAKTVAMAVGQSFYSLSLGMGIIITYSSYVDRKENLIVSGVGTATASLLFSVLAGLAILPAVFAAGIEPGAGPGLIFETLPFIFSTMGASAPALSSIVAILFFLTVLVAALTSSISLVEVGISWLVEERGLSRKRATLLCFAACWALGLLCTNGSVFGTLDLFCSNVLMAINGLLGVIFVGWVLSPKEASDELLSSGNCPGNRFFVKPVYWMIRYLAPVAILAIFLSNIIF